MNELTPADEQLFEVRFFCIWAGTVTIKETVSPSRP